MAILSAYEEEERQPLPKRPPKPFSTTLDPSNTLGFFKSVLDFASSASDFFDNDKDVSDLVNEVKRRQAERRQNKVLKAEKEKKNEVLEAEKEKKKVLDEAAAKSKASSSEKKVASPMDEDEDEVGKEEEKSKFINSWVRGNAENQHTSVNKPVTPLSAGDVTIKSECSDHETELVDDNDVPTSQIKQMDAVPLEPPGLENVQNQKIPQTDNDDNNRGMITPEAIQAFVKLVDAANELAASMSIMKCKLEEFGKELSPTDHGHVEECLDRANQHTVSDHVPAPFQSSHINNSNPGVPMGTVEELPNGNTITNKFTLSNTEQPNGSLSSVVVKATYKEDTVRFIFSLTSNIDQLYEEVGKKFKIEMKKIKIKYQDEDKEWMLLTCVFDLDYALQVSKSSGINCARLYIIGL